MSRHVRHDHIELHYVYGMALAALALFLIVVSLPMDTSRFGLIVPQEEIPTPSTYKVTPFDDLAIQGKAYIVYDLVDKHVIASNNPDMVLPLASITKVMTAITALGHSGKDTKITISSNNIEGGYDLGMKPGQEWRLDELLRYTLVFSSNDGAHAIADSLGGRKAFIELMNSDSALMGLSLKFTDPAGLDVGGRLGGEGTARDVAKLFGIARNRFPEVFEATTKTRLTVTADRTERLSGIPNTNQEIVNLFGAEASKTGFTDNAGGNLGVIVDVTLGRPVVIVVLGSTREERFTDMELLYEALLKSVN